jgi:drug/metabolite transporter (DMT)-like permease
MVATASAYLIGEWPTRGMLAGVSLAAAGVLVIAVGDGLAEPGHLRGDLLALGGAAAFAAYIVVARRARAVVPLVEYLAVVYTVAALALLGAAILAGQPLSGFPSGVWALLAAAALIPQLVGHSSLNWALSHLSATYVSGVTLAEILGSGALAWVVFEEQPAGRTVVGAALIVAGLVTATRAERRRLGSLGPVANR